jgi:aspartyl-tRNA synthetase
MRTLALAVPDQIGSELTVKGWVQSRRDHGGLIFIDLRDHTGIVQLVIRPDNEEGFKIAEEIRDEYVISASGQVAERDDNLKNPNIPTGNVEIILNKLSILNRAEPMPIQMNGEQISSEEQRLRYRFLDLRRDKMQTMLKQRAGMYKIMRSYMESQDFTEVTTPILANSSPEGARDFLIPSRLQAGKFYALPQAPQQFKQLLMVGGVPRYYQLAINWLHVSVTKIQGLTACTASFTSWTLRCHL